MVGHRDKGPGRRRQSTIDRGGSPRQEMRMAEQRGRSGNFATDRKRAAEAGQKGGERSSSNFKHDPERAANAGRKGGRESPGNFKNDPARAVQAGRKGGRNRHGHPP